MSHNRNAADTVTKFKGAHSEPVSTCCELECTRLKGEKNEWADRAAQRPPGTVPRHKVSATQAVTESTFFVHTPRGLRAAEASEPEAQQAQAPAAHSQLGLRLSVSIRTTRWRFTTQAMGLTTPSQSRRVTKAISKFRQAISAAATSINHNALRRRNSSATTLTMPTC